MKKKILLVDDDGIIRKVYRGKLELLGYDVYEATRLPEVCDALDRVDLVLMDTALSRKGEQGYDICRIIKKRKNMPVIGMSSRAYEFLKEKWELACADDFIGKNYMIDHMEELDKRIKELLYEYSMKQ